MLSAFKNFLLTFVIASVIFGVIAYFATIFLKDTMNDILEHSPNAGLDDILHQNPSAPPPVDTETSGPPVVDPPVIDLDGESFNLLFVISDYQPEVYSDYAPNNAYLESVISGYDPGTDQFLKEYRPVTASTMVLFRGDKELGEFVVTPVSSILQVGTPADEMLLGETYGYYGETEDPSGVSFILGKLGYLTGLSIDSYISVNVTELADVLLSIGPVVVDLPCSVYYDGEQYFTVLPAGTAAADGTLPEGTTLIFSPGNQVITPENSSALFLLSERYEDDVFNKQTILYRLMTAYMTELASLPETGIVDLFNNMMTASLLKTNLTGERMAKQADLVKMFGEFTVKQLNYPVKMAGTAGAALTHTVADHNAALSAFKAYR